MKFIQYISIMIIWLSTCPQLWSQGPPITSDKPIMLSARTWELKTLTEVRQTKAGTFSKAPVMLHYLPTSDLLVGVHIPYITYDFDEGERGSSLGDIQLLVKKQLYRNDAMGKTFRVAAKTLQTFGTGRRIGQEGLSTGNFQSYAGILAGYETVKYGILSELGYNLSPYDALDELRLKLGFGLPLLPVSYPVKQLNLYFEYQNSWMLHMDNYMMLFAQGVQYALGRFTVEAAVQVPLIQEMPGLRQRNYSIFIGSRLLF